MRSIFGIHSDPALQFALKLHLDFGHLLMTLLQVYLIFDNTVGKGTVFENYSKCRI